MRLLLVEVFSLRKQEQGKKPLASEALKEDGNYEVQGQEDIIMQGV